MLDLSAILDISEDGMSIQASTPLPLNQKLNFSLDFSETKAHVQLSGVVVWRDRSGRAGIRFEDLSTGGAEEGTLQILKEWMFVNVITACVHRAESTAVRTEDSFEQSQTRNSKTEVGAASLPQLISPASADYTGVLSALVAVRREVEALGTDLDASLRLIVERALVFTRASGAAIAIADIQGSSPSKGSSRDMICRARAGMDAPSIGARLQVGSGFSGECVRTGTLLRCEDTETNPLVDLENCRALGIRSIAAVPIRSGNFVAGILEIFAREPRAFESIPSPVLLRLADTASFAIHRAAQAMVKEHSAERSETARKEQQKKVSRQNDPDVPALFKAEYDLPLSTPRRILLFAVALTLILVVAWLIRTWPHGNHQPALHTTGLSSSEKDKPSQATALPVGIDGLRQLAEQGDAAGQFALGVHYATGEDVPQDYSEAVRWFSLAAQQGHVMAQATLGAYYWAGRGVPQDMEKAYFWALIAETGGDDASKVRVAFLSSHMKRTQILAAQQRVSDWIKEHQLMTGKPS